MFTIPIPNTPVEECPHCGVVSQFSETLFGFIGAEHQHVQSRPSDRSLRVRVCRNCYGEVIHRVRVVVAKKSVVGAGDLENQEELLYPTAKCPPKLPPAVPEDLRTAFTEAWLARGISDRCAAVLARRCLQLVLRRKGYVSHSLDAEISAAEKDAGSELATRLHFVRVVGNIGAHPMAAEGDGNFERLLEVEPGEVDALFGAVEEALDEFFVKPARNQAHLDALNEKLTAAGKPLIKPKGG